MILVDKGIVQGDSSQAKPLVVGKDSVYIHENIEKIEEINKFTNEEYSYYQYHEYQIDKNEFLEDLYMKNLQLEQDITNTQLALCDIFENCINNEEEN